MDNMYNRFRNYVLNNNLISPGEKILLSLSAGKDSMFMLHLMNNLRRELDFAVGVFHLNHLTRGDESDLDEVFVKDRCMELGIPCHIERFDFKRNKSSDISFEEHARSVRYSFLKKISETGCYDKIATAHNMNDNAETVLMRAFSGTGITGIKGISPHVDNIIRPVLFAGKSEIYSFLDNKKIEWREDLSNNDNTYLRNYIRNVVIPAVLTRFPDAEENLFRLSGHAAENQSLLGRLADELHPGAVSKNGDEAVIDVTGFHENIPLVKYYIARTLYEVYGLKIKTSVHKEIVKRYNSESSNMILYEKDHFVIKKGLKSGRKIVSISTGNISSDNMAEWEYTVPLEESIAINVEEIKKSLHAGFVSYEFYKLNSSVDDIVFIRGDNLSGTVKLRNRRPGDRIKTESGTKKIKDLMIEKKLDSKMKNSIPLIVADRDIAAYLPGLVNSDNNRVSCNFHIRKDTKRILAFFFRDY